MKKEIRKVLVINSGSSSLKYQLFDMKTETVTIDGSTMTERIEVPLAGVDFNSGFYKVEIVQ